MGDVLSEHMLNSAVSYCSECMRPKQLKRKFETLPCKEIPEHEFRHTDDVLQFHHDVGDCLVCSDTPNRHRFKESIMSLLLVNKAVNLEATEMLYTTNRFSIMSDFWTLSEDPHLDIFLRKRTRLQKEYIRSLSFVVPYVYIGKSGLCCTNRLDAVLTQDNFRGLTSLRDVSIFLIREEDVDRSLFAAVARRPRIDDCLKVFKDLDLDSFTVTMGSTCGGLTIAPNFPHPERVEFAANLERMVLGRGQDE